MNKKQGFIQLREVMSGYYPLSDETWQALTEICHYRQVTRQTQICRVGEVPRSFAFVCQGLFRVFVLDEKGNEFNKNFFQEGRFPGAMTALLRQEPSLHSIEALEDSTIIEINFQAFRDLLYRSEDLKLFHIHYLERHWLLDKDTREIRLVQQDAAERYQAFQREYPELLTRLPQYHIASHLGVTPTQLSRIRKKS